MYTPCCLALLLLFLVNVSHIGTELCVSGTTQDSSVLPRSFRQACCKRNVHRFPCSTKFRGLSILLLLCGDISLIPGPISFGVVSCRSVRNKGPSISDMMSTDSFRILAMTETHIRPSDNDSFLRSITLAGFTLCHRPRPHGFGGGVGFFVIENIKFKILDSPTYTTFENLVIDIGSSTSPFMIACVYRPPGSCSDEFLDQFLNLFECLSSWFGVGGVVLNWFKSYLCDRYQCIKIGSVLSDAKRLLYGQSPGADLVLIIHYPPQ